MMNKLFLLFFTLLFSISAQAGLLSGLSKLGKAGKKSDDAVGTASAGRYSDNALGKGMHGDEALGGAGGYVDDISLPNTAIEIGGALFNVGANLAEAASEAALEEALSIAAETAFPDDKENQVLLKRALLDEPQTLNRNNRGIILFTNAEAKTRANAIYIGKANNKIKTARVSQFICNTGSQWQRFTTLQSLLARAIKNECKLRHKQTVLFLNHGGFVDFQPSQLPEDQTVKAAFTYAADSTSNRVHKIDLEHHTRRLEKCCLYGDTSIHPAIKNSLETVKLGTENNTQLIIVGTAHEDIKALATAKKLQLVEVHDSSKLKALHQKAHYGTQNVIFFGEGPKPGSYRIGNEVIALYTNIIAQPGITVLYISHQASDASSNMPLLRALNNMGDTHSNNEANAWQFLSQFGTLKSLITLSETSKTKHTANFHGVNTKGTMQLAFTLTNDVTSCNPYIWDCPAIYTPINWFDIVAYILAFIVGLLFLWKLLKLKLRFERYALGLIKSFFIKK